MPIIKTKAANLERYIRSLGIFFINTTGIRYAYMAIIGADKAPIMDKTDGLHTAKTHNSVNKIKVLSNFIFFTFKVFLSSWFFQVASCNIIPHNPSLVPVKCPKYELAMARNAIRGKVYRSIDEL